MQKWIILSALLIALCTGCGKKVFSSGRLQQPKGEFSYVTPDGWHRTKLAGVDFIIISTDAESGIKPNLFVDEIFTASQLSDVAVRVSGKNKTALRAYKIEIQSDFTTQSGLSGIKIQAHHRTKQDLPLATFQYLIQDADRVISITCTCAGAVKIKYEPIFDAVINSLQSELTNQ
jgi:hypothetical protein